MKAKAKRSTKKAGTKKILFTSLVISAAGILGYFGLHYLKKKRAATGETNMNEVLKSLSTDYTPKQGSPSPKPATKKTSPAISAKDPNAFPLKKGSNGSNVTRLQEALIIKYGKSILPRYGADGDFGSETVNALKKLRLPDVVTESVLNMLIQETKIDGATLGKDLYNAAITRNYNKALTLLKKLKTTDDYASANEVFKQGRIAGVRQTIVNALLNIFSNETQKQSIKLEFLRLGLQFDGHKWSLSGFDGPSIITKEPTTVWMNATNGVKVPARMVLGNEISKRLDYTLFENGGKYFLVGTKSVQYLN